MGNLKDFKQQVAMIRLQFRKLTSAAERWVPGKGEIFFTNSGGSCGNEASRKIPGNC